MPTPQNIARAIKEMIKRRGLSLTVGLPLLRALLAVVIMSLAGHAWGAATSYNCGYTWTEQTSSGQRYWWKIASSRDGVHMAAAEYNGYIYTSSDNGTTWVQQTKSGQRAWYSITSSTDGSHLAAVDNTPNGYIYTSADYGVTWTARTNARSPDWMAVASNADGSILFAADYSGSSNIYKSQDGGASWVAHSTACGQSGCGNIGGKYWYTVATSDDATTIIAGPSNGDVYTSSDNGTTWTGQTSAGQKFWWSIASSWDGVKLAAVEGYGGYIYTSADSGVTWTQQTGPGSLNWTSISSGPDGFNLAATSFSTDGYIYTSPNSGSNWTQETGAGSRLWTSSVVAAGGDKIAATVFGGYIYTAARPKYNVSVTKTGTGSGTVVSSSGPLTWSGNTGTALYLCPQFVTLTALPNPGNSFSGWTGCDSSSGAQCTVVMAATKNVTSVFGVPLTDQTMTVTTTGNGTVTSSPTGINCGTQGASCKSTFADNTTVTLTAAADPGYGFKSWSGCDSINGSQCTVLMSSNKAVSAVFNNSHIFTVNNTGNGTIVSNPLGIYCGSACMASYTDNTTLILLAVANPGYGFKSWTGCNSTIAEQCTVLVSSDNLTATATFDTNANLTYTAASAAISSIYSKMSSFFGTPLGGVTAGTDNNGTNYVQWYTSGTALLAWSDGYMYYYYYQAWYYTGIKWRPDTLDDFQKASTMINNLYTQNSSFYGTPSGNVTAYSSANGTYYIQWYSNAGLLAGWNGYMYVYYNGTWVYTGANWK
ncbi:MAG: exo-alpha-sialidase [Nitrospirae bacterium]|nr:exo-alpha-sialidase [Nitrospirota bacterium]